MSIEKNTHKIAKEAVEKAEMAQELSENHVEKMQEEEK